MTKFPRRLAALAAIPWHPAVLVIVIILAFWMDAVVSPFAAFRSFAIGILGAAALTALLGLGLRNLHFGGVAATGIIGLLYTKRLVRLVEYVGPKMPVAVLIAWLVLMLLMAVVVARLLIRTA